MDLCEKVADFILEEHLLQPGQGVIVALSGGADSLCLLDCLQRLEYEIVVAHLDHQLRSGSASDAAFCREIARSYGLPIEIQQMNVSDHARKARLSLEEAGRALRYAFLARVAYQNDIKTVCTGHTADDQVETILMHLVRGAGPSGLQGILPKSALDTWVDAPEAAGISLQRPLLGVYSEETLAHCRAVGLQPLCDPTNVELAFVRNRIRHELLPLLEALNPGIRGVLLRMARLMGGVSNLLDELVGERWPAIVRSVGEDALALDAKALREMPLAIQRAIFQRAISRLRPGKREIGFEVLDRAVEFLEERGVRRLSLVSDLELSRLADEVILSGSKAAVGSSAHPQLKADDRQPLQSSCEVELAEGWRFCAKSVRISPDLLDELMNETSRWRAALDADRVDERDLHLRGPYPGDRIRPLGMQGRTKLSDLFINEAIPRQLRARWPVVVSGGEVVWVGGLRLAHEFRLRDETTRALLLRLIPPGNES